MSVVCLCGRHNLVVFVHIAVTNIRAGLSAIRLILIADPFHNQSYEVATISRLPKKNKSLLQKSPTKEIDILQERPTLLRSLTNDSHPISAIRLILKSVLSAMRLILIAVLSHEIFVTNEYLKLARKIGTAIRISLMALISDRCTHYSPFISDCRFILLNCANVGCNCLLLSMAIALLTSY